MSREDEIKQTLKKEKPSNKHYLIILLAVALIAAAYLIATKPDILQGVLQPTTVNIQNSRDAGAAASNIGKSIQDASTSIDEIIRDVG